MDLFYKELKHHFRIYQTCSSYLDINGFVLTWRLHSLLFPLMNCICLLWSHNQLIVMESSQQWVSASWLKNYINKKNRDDNMQPGCVALDRKKKQKQMRFFQWIYIKYTVALLQCCFCYSVFLAPKKSTDWSD